MGDCHFREYIMKFKIKKNTNVMARPSGSLWDFEKGFVELTTDVNVTFDVGDLWFAPMDMHLIGSGTATLLRGNTANQCRYNYTIRNYYGFHLPKNARDIKQIIVKRTDVNLLAEGVADEQAFRNREEKRMLRKMDQPSGGYILPGQPSK